MSPRFSQMPTLGEFMRRARRYEFIRRRTPGVQGPRGEARITYLWRKDGVFVDLPDIHESDRLTRNTVEHLCRRLRIPVDDFIESGDDS